MNKIYLIKVPHEYHIHDRNWPIGLLYISSYLKSKGFCVSIIDLSGLKPEQWNIPLDGNFYGVSCTTPDYHHAVKISQILSEKTSACLIIGGVHASSRPIESLSNSMFDVAVIGEGEETMADIVSGKEFSSISGICYKENGLIKQNGRRPLIENIDSLPPPDISDLDYKSYIQPIIIKDTKSVGVAMITARGCPYECIFCASSHMWKRHIRFHNSNYIEKEIRAIMDLGINYFFFCDDTFLIKKERTKELLNIIKRLGIIWRCSATTNMLTPELAQSMFEAGCRQMDFGIESGSDRMLSIMKKKSRVKDNVSGIKIARDAGIMTKAMLMVGLPHETEEDVMETIRFVTENDSDMYALTVFVPLPGCDVSDNLSKYSFEIDENISYKDYFIVGSNKQTPIVHKNKEKIEKWRDMIWSAIGKRSTLDVIAMRECEEK
ncbi:MAG: radical SAM protein [Desulfobacterales bacterium]|nr:radical SAM protein [Desulfobacterales bacterium]